MDKNSTLTRSTYSGKDSNRLPKNERERFKASLSVHLNNAKAVPVHGLDKKHRENSDKSLYRVQNNRDTRIFVRNNDLAQYLAIDKKRVNLIRTMSKKRHGKG